ncbi:hypothetical protein QTP88_006179 [Uroleucon formosanum]
MIIVDEYTTTRCAELIPLPSKRTRDKDGKRTMTQSQHRVNAELRCTIKAVQEAKEKYYSVETLALSHHRLHDLLSPAMLQATVDCFNSLMRFIIKLFRAQDVRHNKNVCDNLKYFTAYSVRIMYFDVSRQRLWLDKDNGGGGGNAAVLPVVGNRNTGAPAVCTGRSKGQAHRRCLQRAVGVYNTISCGDRWTRTPSAADPTTGLVRHAMRAPLRYVVRILFAILGIPQTERGFVFTS